MYEDIIDRLRIRAGIRRNNKDRKSVQEGKSDRICDLLEEAANEIESLRNSLEAHREIRHWR
jgi:hypothetical protein